MNRFSFAIVSTLFLATSGCAIETASQGEPEPGEGETPIVGVVAPSTSDTVPRAGAALDGVDVTRPLTAVRDPDPNPWTSQLDGPSPRDPDPNPWCKLCYARTATVSTLDPDPNPWCTLCFPNSRDPDPNPWKSGSAIDSALR